MKNRYEIRGDVAVIFIPSPKYGNFETKISLSHLERAKDFKNTWCLRYQSTTKSAYVFGGITTSRNKRTVCLLHRWIMGLPEGMVIDHINHDTLDNTIGNLRIVTSAQNCQNRNVRRTSRSGRRGVTWKSREQKWIARIQVSGRSRYLGEYDDIEEAAEVANEARRKYLPYSIN